MIDSLRVQYGEFIGEIGNRKFYSFPSVEAIANAKEDDLRELGMGYRAGFLINSAIKLQELANERGCDAAKVLYDLRKSESRQQVAEFLIQFPGIGRKVADCIALFSLDQLDSIPVDTHVWQIAQKYYKAKLNPAFQKHKSLTDNVYADIGDMFRNMYGLYSGWAHSVLFTADLKSFQHYLLPKVKKEETETEAPASIVKREDLCDLSLSNVIPFQKRKQKKRKCDF
jgi:N-glycosylase/DNA lyase